MSKREIIEEELNELDEPEIPKNKTKKSKKEKKEEKKKEEEKQDYEENNNEEKKEKEDNKTYKKDYVEMSKEESDEKLKMHLKRIGLSKYYDLFIEEEIRMKHFWVLNDDDLKYLGVKLGDRKEILRYIKNVLNKSKINV